AHSVVLRAAGSAPGRPLTDETAPKTAVPPLFCALRLPTGTASARRAPGQRCSVPSHGPVLNMDLKYRRNVFNLDKTALSLCVEHRRDSSTVSPKIKHARGSRLECRSG